MHRSRLLIVAMIQVLVFALVSRPVAAAPPTGATAPAAAKSSTSVRPACDTTPGARRVHCLALLRTSTDGTPLTFHADSASDLPPGYGPAQLQSAYELASAAASRGDERTVAVVDAFDAPKAEADLNAYRAKFGLPPCTSDNGCFRKVNQDGESSPLPPPDAGWALEASLDIDMVSAACPRCHILLVESDDNQDVNMAAAVATAAKLGATEISNSYGEPEYPEERKLEPFYNQPGVAITAAAGDSGYGVSYPAASASVTAVGGTSLWPAGGTRHWTETTWAGSGSGCSTQIPKPAWQHDSCTHRSDNDLAAVADPNTPLAVYDSYGQPGWVQVGGTSASAPLIAGIYALIGDAAQQAKGGSYPYEHGKNFFDITSGTNGDTCSPTFLCTAGTGYDAPTGIGTPDYTGTGAGSGTCTSGWSVAPTPNQSDRLERGETPFSRLRAVDALSPSDVWTAGLYFEALERGPAASLGALGDVEHWNGSEWERTPTSNPLALQTTLAFVEPIAMSFDRPDDGWLAGYYQDYSDQRPMVQHWNGKKWSLSPVVSPPQSAQRSTGETITTAQWVQDVAAISPTDVWLTIVTKDFDNNQLPSYLEHWDGHAWRIVDYPGQANSMVVSGMHAFSSTDVWAVGWNQPDSSHAVPVALHWDGRAWSATAPEVQEPVGAFRSVSGTAPDDLWAAGTNGSEPFIEHWDGHAWKIVPTVDAGSVASGLTTLESVTAISRNDAWAVGFYAPAKYLLEHWDGHEWKIVPAPSATVQDALWDVSASGTDNVWAVGAQGMWSPAGEGVYNYAIRNVCRGE